MITTIVKIVLAAIFVCLFIGSATALLGCIFNLDEIERIGVTIVTVGVILLLLLSGIPGASWLAIQILEG